MARLQAGAVALRHDWQSLEELAGSAIRSVESALVVHPVHVNLPGDLPLLYGDGVLLERLLANLFENAAKYTPAGTPITLTARHEGAQMVVEVSDEGPGFPPGDTELLFEKFARGNKESRTPGVGLGLAICRAIVQAHGGTISASNRTPPEHGAVLRWTCRSSRRRTCPKASRRLRRHHNDADGQPGPHPRRRGRPADPSFRAPGARRRRPPGLRHRHAQAWPDRSRYTPARPADPRPRPARRRRRRPAARPARLEQPAGDRAVGTRRRGRQDRSARRGRRRLPRQAVFSGRVAGTRARGLAPPRPREHPGHQRVHVRRLRDRPRAPPGAPRRRARSPDAGRIQARGGADQPRRPGADASATAARGLGARRAWSTTTTCASTSATCAASSKPTRRGRCTSSPKPASATASWRSPAQALSDFPWRG